MHEWALAEGIVQTIRNKIKESSIKKVLEINIILGELQDIDERIIIYAIKEISKNTLLEGAEVKLNIEKARFKCGDCGFEWEIGDVESNIKEEQEEIHFIPELVHAFIKCPNCKSMDFEILKGRKLWIENIKALK